jgi:hypothetical protein
VGITSPAVTPNIFIISDQGTTVCQGVDVAFTAFAVNGGTQARLMSGW